MAETLDLAAAARDHAALLAQIAAANHDLATRIQMLGVSVVYDDDIDILFCQFGPPTEALTETVNDWLAVRVDPETLKILGFELMSLRLPGSGDGRLRQQADPGGGAGPGAWPLRAPRRSPGRACQPG